MPHLIYPRSCEYRPPPLGRQRYLGEVTVGSVVATALGLALGSTWIAIRHAPMAWVLQDILGFFLLCSFLESVYITTLKVRQRLFYVAGILSPF